MFLLEGGHGGLSALLGESLKLIIYLLEKSLLTCKWLDMFCVICEPCIIDISFPLSLNDEICEISNVLGISPLTAIRLLVSISLKLNYCCDEWWVMSPALKSVKFYTKGFNKLFTFEHDWMLDSKEWSKITLSWQYWLWIPFNAG